MTNSFCFVSFYIHFNQLIHFYFDLKLIIKKNSLFFFKKFNNFRNFFILKKNIFKNRFRFNKFFLIINFFKNNKNLHLIKKSKKTFFHNYFSLYLFNFFKN